MYASKRSRSWQNDVDSAWSDAKYMFEISAIIPLVGLFYAAWTIAENIFPHSIGKFEMSAAGQGALLLVLWICLEVYLGRIANKYKDSAIPLEKFNSSSDRAKINIAMATSLTLFIGEMTFIWIFR
jgi:hypothetical protein